MNPAIKPVMNFKIVFNPFGVIPTQVNTNGYVKEDDQIEKLKPASKRMLTTNQPTVKTLIHLPE